MIEWEAPQLRELSAVAGVLDVYGGFCTVVTQLWRMHHHARHDELIFVVPDLWVEEPVEWDRIPWVIGQSRKIVDDWIATRNDPDNLEVENVKHYLIRSRPTTHKRTLDLESIVET